MTTQRQSSGSDVGGVVHRVAALCAGYGGLEMGLAQVLPIELAWYAEVDPAACKVMEAHHPGVLNVGDITVTNWEEQPRVDVVTAGYPCQPFQPCGQAQGHEG